MGSNCISLGGEPIDFTVTEVNSLKNNPGTCRMVRYNGNEYLVYTHDKELTVKRIRGTSTQCCPFASRIFSALYDFFARWAQTGCFEQAFTTRAETIKTAITELIKYSHELGGDDMVAIYQDQVHVFYARINHNGSEERADKKIVKAVQCHNEQMETKRLKNKILNP